MNTPAAVVSPALCRLMKRCTVARVRTATAAARAAAACMAESHVYAAALDAATQNAAAVPVWEDVAACMAELQKSRDITAARAVTAATLETYAENAALRGDNRAARYACKAAIYAERDALAA